MDIITGYTGTKHVTAENDRDINIGIFGSGSYVLSTGAGLKAEISSNNEIKIRDGVIMHQGCAAAIKKNTYDSLTIVNGSQGMKRIDLIVARYEKQRDTNVESLTLKVLQGKAVESSPTAPAHTTGDIQVGDAIADMPLYEVVIDGLNITEVRKKFRTVEDLASLSQKGAKVISKDDFGIVIDTGHSHVRFGTATRPTARDGSGNRYIKLWSANEIATLLKVPQINVHFFDLSIRNGDGTANPMHFYAPEYWNDGNFYVYTWLGNDGNVRISYRMEYPTIDI